jgi:hypothetical protein
MDDVSALVEAPAARRISVDPDAELVAAARREPQAFLALYDRYFGRVLGYVRVRCSGCGTARGWRSTRSERSSAPHPGRSASASTGFSKRRVR